MVAIPSVSSQPDREPIERSANAVATLFENLGLETSVLSEEDQNGKMGMPAVLARKIVDPNAPTVLLYAHHDVQPAGPLQRWKTDPFKATLKDGRLYGRGASDDGAGIITHFGALSVLGEDLPVNVVCYIEGEEEIGSPSFRNFLQTHRDKLDADVIVVCDSNNWRAGHPALTTSLRGVATIEVKLKVLDSALHSGAYGGPIIDAVSCGAILISRLFNPDGSVAVPGLGGSHSAQVDYPEETFRSDARLVDSYQLAGKGDLAARLWYQPALAVIGWDQRSVSEAANAIQPETTFQLSLRVAPGMDAQESAEKLVAFLDEQVPFGAEIKTAILESGPSYQAEHSEAREIMQWALKESWQVDPVDIGCGGAIPMTADFKAVFPHAQVLITGVEDPLTNAHSENESQDINDLKNAICAEALLLAKLGGKI